MVTGTRQHQEHWRIYIPLRSRPLGAELPVGTGTLTTLACHPSQLPPPPHHHWTSTSPSSPLLHGGLQQEDSQGKWDKMRISTVLRSPLGSFLQSGTAPTQLGKAHHPAATTRTNTADKNERQGFPGGAVVGNLPAKPGDTGSSPGPGISHMPWSN